MTCLCSTGWRASSFIALGLLLLAGATRAEPGEARYEWQNVVVGDGGFIPGIVFSRVEEGLAYVRTDIGGAYRWDAQSERWLALQDAMHEPNWFGIESIAPDPVDADVVYAAAGMYRRDGAVMLRSRDRGTTWDVFPVAFRMGGNEDGRGLGERLAIDPNETTTLYFGSRHDGLQRSVDAGETWQRVDAFPHHGLGAPARGRRTNGGLSFVVIDAGSGSPGKRSQTLYVGVADAGAHHLYRSDDAGRTWEAIAGQPRSSLLPAQAELDERGTLYVTYSDGIGPSGVTEGRVFKYDTQGGTWTDVTPPRTNEAREGGYMGIGIDRQQDDTLVVATMNRYNRGDTIWRSTDAGESWQDLRPLSGRDVSAMPFLLWGNEQADFGWWIAALAIDPFNSDHVAYGTGATIYATDELSKAAEEKPVVWRPWVDGIEHTAIITLVSPTEGARLLSGFGDISGFAHRDLDASPAAQFRNPVFANTNTIDYAGAAPNIVVRSGTPPHRATGVEPTFAWSADYGRSWQRLRSPRLNDAAETWLRLNDDRHEWGRRFRVIAGDPRIFGRVYVGTDGRGILYGDPAAGSGLRSD